MNNDSTKDEGALDISQIQPRAQRDVAARERAERQMFEKVDGRSLRRGNRTTPLSFRVKPETKDRLHRLAVGTGKTYTDIFEEALDIYDKMLQGKVRKVEE